MIWQLLFIKKVFSAGYYHYFGSRGHRKARTDGFTLFARTTSSVKYLIPLLAIALVSCKKTACYRCTTTVTVPVDPNNPEPPSTWYNDMCDFSEADAREYEQRGTSYLRYRQTTVKCVKQ